MVIRLLLLITAPTVFENHLALWPLPTELAMTEFFRKVQYSRNPADHVLPSKCVDDLCFGYFFGMRRKLMFFEFLLSRHHGD